MLRTLLKVVQILNTISSLAVVHIHMKRPVSGKYIGKLTAKKLMNSICQIANAQKNGKAYIKMHHALALITFTKHSKQEITWTLLLGKEILLILMRK